MDISTANFLILQFVTGFFVCFGVAGIVYFVFFAFRRLSGV